MAKENIIHFPAKCTVCNDVLQQNEIVGHKCFVSSQNIFINENGELVPQRENTIMTPSTSQSTVASSSPSTSSASTLHHVPGTTATQDDIEEILIAEVQKRRELWDHTLPVSKRSREVLASHWEEISKELNGILTPFSALKKWRYLRDSYMRIRNEQLKKKSGSAASKAIKWKWFSYMEFLNDTQDFCSTTSNIPSSEHSASTNEIIEVEEQTRPLKRRKKDDMKK